MKETNWMENERVNAFLDANLYGLTLNPYRHTLIISELLQIVAEEALKGAEATMDNRKWISVDERLPDSMDDIWAIMLPHTYGAHAIAGMDLLDHNDYCATNGKGHANATPYTHWTERIVDTPPPFTK